MPKIKDVKPYINETLSSLKSINGVNSLYIWGSYASNINDLKYRIRDIDVLAKTKFHSGDLVSIDNKIVKSLCSDSYLEKEGYDPRAIKFSNSFLSFSKYNIDCWAISIDRKLVHWGPVLVNKKEAEEVNKEAENHTMKITGLSRKNINRSSEKVRTNWYSHYSNYVNSCFEGMPTGWYKTEDIKIKEILKNTIKI